MRRSIGNRKPNRAKADATPMDAALKFLTHAARSQRETERHLDQLEFDEVAVYETVERLKELRLIDDEAYAAEFVATRLSTKPVSRENLRRQLLQHKVAESAIDKALSGLDEETEASNAVLVAQKYLRQLAALPEEERTRRVLQRLLSRGYAFDTAREALEQALHGEEDA